MVAVARPARAWCFGGGRNAAAGIIDDVRRGEPIDLVTFADHGGEKRRPNPEEGDEVGTYEFIPIFDEWCREHLGIGVTICTYQPLPETHQRYSAAARQVVERLDLKTLSEEDINRLAGIYGNMVANDTLPSIAFGGKGCSVKWKIEAQEPT